MDDRSCEGIQEIPKPNLDIESDVYSSYQFQNYKYISPDKLAKYLSDPTSHQYDFLLILDARFQYEFRGGRIIGAKNITTFSSMTRFYDQYKDKIANEKSICIVIHCELSSHRGPKLYDMIREYDRNKHISQYPSLSFPDLFLLDGGYKKIL